MTWWIWLILGLVLLAAELLTPGGLYLFFLGLSALAVGGLVAIRDSLPLWGQWLLFSILSMILALFFRRPLLEWIRRFSHKTVATATAEGLRKVAEAIQTPGGFQALQLRVAEQYIAQFGNLAKAGNTLVIPATLSDVSAMIAAAMTAVRAAPSSGKPTAPSE